MRRAASGNSFNGPLTVRTPEGRQLAISRSSLYFDETGALKADDWPHYAEYKDLVDPLLASLVSSRRLVPGALLSPAAQPVGGARSDTALILQSAGMGAVGSNIQVVFANVVPDEADPAQTRFDAAVTGAQKFAGLSADPSSDSFLGKVLGTDKNAGMQSALIHLMETGEPKHPRAGQYALTGGGSGKKSRAEVPGAEGIAFTLEASNPGKDGDNITVTISDTKGKTFTLAAVWEKTAEGLTSADLPNNLPGSGYLLTVKAPDSGFAAPRAGKVTLSGGSETSPASAQVPR